MKPTIVGESNPYGGDDYYALYPAPDGCSGHRLCCMILGMHRPTYLDRFNRVNLVRGPWNMRAARARVTELMDQSENGRFILLGRRVCDAWAIPFKPFESYNPRDSISCLVFPHPSGLNRMWSEPGIIDRARAAIIEWHPQLEQHLGIDIE